jgi:hypothetical protein
MSSYGDAHTNVDSSSWQQPVASHRDGEPVPAPAPMQQTANGTERLPTPDPYTNNSGSTVRNFGRS